MRATLWSLRPVCLGACVVVGLSTPSQALPRTELSGFGDIRFGMTEAELRKSIRFLDDVRKVEDGSWLTGAETIDIAGGEFALNILLDHGSVRRISLLDLAPVPTPDCQPGFDRMVDYVEGQYGPPDTRGKDVPQVIAESYKARFKFADGGQIVVGTFLNGSGKECGNSIAFFVPHDAPPEKPQAPGDA